MLRERILPVKNWFATYFLRPNTKETKQPTYLNIPIQSTNTKKSFVPIHFSSAIHKTQKINKAVLNALGGVNNIESYQEIPNSRRIRLTLINPSLVDNALLEELDVRMFIRIGKRIVHIIP